MKIETGAIKKLLHLIKQERGPLFVFTVVIILTSLFEALGIGVLYPILNIVESQAKRAEYIEMVNNLLPFTLGDNLSIMMLFIVAYILFIVRGLFISLSYYSQFRLSERLRTKWQSDIFDSYMNQDYDFFIRHKAGDLLQKQMVHTESAGNAVVYSCQIARNLFTAMLLFIMLCLISLKGTLILMAILAVTSLLAFLISKFKIHASSKEHARLQKESYSIAAEIIAGIRQIKVFLAEDFFRKRFFETVKRKARIYTKNATISHLPAPVMQTIVLLAMLTVLLFVSGQKQNAAGMLAMIAVFGGTAYRIITSIACINSGLMQITHLLPSINIVADLLCLKNIKKVHSKIAVFKDSIKFSDASFAYPRKGFEISDVSLEFKKGKFYGIVGPSGSGKSTLIDLIIGFYQCNSGKIIVDGEDLGEVDMFSWRKIIGLISQETFIFHGSVEKNISFAVEEADVVTDRVMQAAKSADIHDFIMDLPEGYKTVVGERGLKLSGGQRQRLAIARAIYRNPEIYIFDEATSSLDTYSERKIQRSIEDLSQSKTVIAVAHRLSTVINADKIIVMKNGQIVEFGSHRELLDKKGAYADLYAHQHDQKLT